MANNYKFDKGDTILCYDDNILVYEAKCLDRRRTTDGIAEYLIHFKGWESKWDTWLNEDRLLYMNFDSKNKMELLNEAQTVPGNVKYNISFIYGAPLQKTIIKRPTMPAAIKKILVLDFNNVGKGKVLRFPEYFTVDTLIRNYIYNAISENRDDAVVQGLSLINIFHSHVVENRIFYPEETTYCLLQKAKNHFDRKLETRSIEGHSWNQYVPENVYSHYVYQPTYLLRLLIQLPFLINQMEHFWKFVENNLNIYFSEDEYIDMS